MTNIKANTGTITAGKTERLTGTDKKIKKQHDIAYAALRTEALEAMQDFKRCMNNFNFVSEEKLVDVCIYEIQKSMSRYEYLLSEIKSHSR